MNDETRKIAYETWRFQVDSYWTRNSYFAGFQIAAMVGIWKVIDGHPPIGATLASLCAALTLVWMFNNHRVHEYIELWWKKAELLDPKSLELAKGFDNFREDHRKGKSPLLKAIRARSYSSAMQLIPLLFLIGWGVLICYALQLKLQFNPPLGSNVHILKVNSWPDLILGAAALVTAVFAVVQAYAARANAEAAKSSAEAMTNAERAWVMVEVGGIPDFKPDVTHLEVLWIAPALKNTGRTAARINKIVVRAHQLSKLSDLPPEPEYASRETIVIERDVLLPSSLNLQPVQIPVSGFDFAEIREGRIKLCLYGQVDYLDIGGNQRYTRFCYSYHKQGGYSPSPTGFYVSTEVPSAYTKMT